MTENEEGAEVTALDVAQAVLDQTGPLDTFKLQKLVYYCQAWHLVWADEPLFDEPIEAWANGPVIPRLYGQHRGEFRVVDIPGGDSSRLSKRQRRTVHSVIEGYGHLSGRQLARLTHEESPWSNARAGLAPGDHGNHEISRASMKSYYLALDSSPDAQLVEAIPSEPVD